MERESLLSNSFPTLSGNVQPKSLDSSLFTDLSAGIKGTIYLRSDPGFEIHSKIFNGDVISPAALLVRPFDTEDVSRIVRFCTKNSLSLSVKAGGYGTHGQAVQGDVIIDISLLNDIHAESINEQGGFTSLKDMPSAKHAGKIRQSGDAPLSNETPMELWNSLGKRSADDAFGLKSWLAFGAAGALHTPSASGSGSISAESENPPPSARRRISPFDRTIFDPPPGSSGIMDSRDGLGPSQAGSGSPFSLGAVSTIDGARHNSSGSNSSGEEGVSMSSRSTSNLSVQSHGGISISTSGTSVDLHPSKPDPPSDPFGYMSSETASVGGNMDTSPHGAEAPSSSHRPPYAPVVPPVVPSFAMNTFSPSGHYTPTRVVPSAPHAYMTFGAGAKQKDIDIYSASHPLPATSLSGQPCFTPYHVPFSAHPVGSSVMLLGGFGFLSRLHGLSMDNLVEAEMVLADGSIVIVSEQENEELFWTLRGAGPIFGIVTRFKAKAYPVPVVYAGNIIYKFRKSTAASLIKHFRDCVKNVPRELYANVILTAGPDGDALLVIQICYLGPQEQGIEFLQAITSWDGEQCLLNEVSEKSFLNQQDSLAQLIRGKPGRKWFIRSDLINSLSDDTIHETVMRFSDTPPGCTWLFELTGGNVADEHGGCFPASSRQANWTVAAFHQWELHEDDPRCVTSAEDWINETLSATSVGGPYPCFFGIHESMKRIKGSFGGNWERLCVLKGKYDPSGLFSHTFWPLDEHGEPKTTLVPTRTEF